MNSIQHMKMAAYQELRDAKQIKKVNDELLEFLAASLRWIIRYCQRHDMPVPEKDKIIELMDRAMAIEDKLPYEDEYRQSSDESYHSDDEEDDRH